MWFSLGECSLIEWEETALCQAPDWLVPWENDFSSHFSEHMWVFLSARGDRVLVSGLGMEMCLVS